MGDDGEEDEYEKAWDEEAEEAEDDVMSLTLSFNFTQALRFSINGKLPNQEGQEDPHDLENHTNTQMLRLFGVGMTCAAVMVTIYMFKSKQEKEEEKEEHDHEHGHSDSEGNEHHSEPEKSPWEALIHRVTDISIITLSMCFAWCSFFTLRMSLASSKMAISDPMVLATATTLTISLVSFSSIRLLDMIADADWTDERADDAIVQFIKAIGILVGFGWEQCFDQAVDSLSSALPHPHFFKGVLAIFCVGIVVPAWKWFVLPMSLQNGWKFGYVVDEEQEEKNEELLQELLAKRRKEKTGEYEALAGGPEESKLKGESCITGRSAPSGAPCNNDVNTSEELLRALGRAKKVESDLVVSQAATRKAETALAASRAEAASLKSQIDELHRQFQVTRQAGGQLQTDVGNLSNAVTSTSSTHSPSSGFRGMRINMHSSGLGVRSGGYGASGVSLLERENNMYSGHPVSGSGSRNASPRQMSPRLNMSPRQVSPRRQNPVLLSDLQHLESLADEVRKLGATLERYRN